MSKPTPGPWSVNTLGGPNRTEVFAGDALICDTYSGTVAYTEECRANARLIAAAPDLLAALKQAQQTIYDRTWGFPQTVLNQIAAAIAKAEGRDA